ncbi:MAG: NAD(P)/FAD-dependent oxidoreductase [Streptosporangiales bacterium]
MVLRQRRAPSRAASPGPLRALAGAKLRPYWLDDPDVPDPLPALVGGMTCDLAVVGAGFTGLWAALLAKERDPSRDVTVLEASTVGGAASGRNGGFCDASLTHGLANGLGRFPDEMGELERLGAENLDGIEKAVRRYGIDCDFERTGEVTVATGEWQLAELAEEARVAPDYGHEVELMTEERVRDEVHSPTYLGGLWTKNRTALVNPARLAWGLRAACLSLGVRIHEHTPVTRLAPDRAGVRLATPYGAVRTGRVALATNAARPLLRRLRAYVVPVYDYALATEPLSATQRASIGWQRRQGLGDAGNQFHYYRLTRDDRILWGGYDAIYTFGNGQRAELDARQETFATLARHFFETFPQLDGVRFTHAWGGAIDTCSRFCPFWGTAYDGRLAYVAGYTGLGVGASRFGAQVMLDHLAGEETERTRLRLVRTKPVPFPPEPLRYGVIQLTRWSLDRADHDQGRRNLWLRTLDRLGLGFDS